LLRRNWKDWRSNLVSTVSLFGELERILECKFNIRRPTYHAGGDICGNKAPRLMTTPMKVMCQFNQYLQVEQAESGGTDRARRETKKQCQDVGNALLNFHRFPSLLLHTPQKDLTPAIFAQAKQYSKKPWNFGKY
jgi:hypothetical protein